MATKSSGSRSKSGSGSRRGGAGSGGGADRADKSVEAFRDALERSVTLSRDRLQEVFDEAVERGRMTRSDANELVSKLVSRGRSYSDDLIHDLERMVDQVRTEVESRGRAGRRQAGRAARAARDVADPALAEADRIRRRAGIGARSPITAYDQLTAAQVNARLADLSRAELRRVRKHEEKGKARKTVLAEIDKRLGS
jgi:polyhydroxyalkanoate synthesis regulator phasin